MSYSKSHIQEAKIISESLNDSGNPFIDFIARQADKITSNNRGSWVTETIVLADLARNNDALRTAYNQNKQPIDEFFNQIDVEKAVQDFGRDIGKQIQISTKERIKNNVPGFAAGIAAGLIIAAIRKK